MGYLVEHGQLVFREQIVARYRFLMSLSCLQMCVQMKRFLPGCFGDLAWKPENK